MVINLNKDYIQRKLKELENIVKSGDFFEDARNVREWGGADVVISRRMTPSIKAWLGNQNVVISFQNSVPKKRVVITKYSKELSWLFYQLRDFFYFKVDYISKYDFFGLLAQAAINYLDSVDTVYPKDLLLIVLKEAEAYLNA